MFRKKNTSIAVEDDEEDVEDGYNNNINVAMLCCLRQFIQVWWLSKRYFNDKQQRETKGRVQK